MANLNPNQVARAAQSTKSAGNLTGTFNTTARGAAAGASRPTRAADPGNAHVTPGQRGRGNGARHPRLTPLHPPTAPGRARRKGTA